MGALISGVRKRVSANPADQHSSETRLRNEFASPNVAKLAWNSGAGCGSPEVMARIDTGFGQKSWRLLLRGFGSVFRGTEIRQCELDDGRATWARLHRQASAGHPCTPLHAAYPES